MPATIRMYFTTIAIISSFCLGVTTTTNALNFINGLRATYFIKYNKISGTNSLRTKLISIGHVYGKVCQFTILIKPIKI